MAKMAFFLDLEGWPCLVTGGGEKAARAAARLLENGALLSCWSTEFSQPFLDMERSYPDRIALIRGELSPDLLDHMIRNPKGPRLVVLASQNEEMEARLFSICEDHDIPAACPGKRARLSLGSTIPRGAISFGVGSETTPELEDLWQRRLEREIPRDYIEGSKALALELNSPAMRKMHPELRDRRASELSSSLMESKGNWEEVLAKIRRKNILS